MPSLRNFFSRNKNNNDNNKSSLDVETQSLAEKTPNSSNPNLNNTHSQTDGFAKVLREHEERHNHQQQQQQNDKSETGIPAGLKSRDGVQKSSSLSGWVDVNKEIQKMLWPICCDWLDGVCEFQDKAECCAYLHESLPGSSRPCQYGEKCPSKHWKRNWEPDKASIHCRHCLKEFNLIRRRHHCRNCGQLHCDECIKEIHPIGKTCLLCEFKMKVAAQGNGSSVIESSRVIHNREELLAKYTTFSPEKEEEEENRENNNNNNNINRENDDDDDVATTQQKNNASLLKDDDDANRNLDLTRQSINWNASYHDKEDEDEEHHDDDASQQDQHQNNGAIANVRSYNGTTKNNNNNNDIDDDVDDALDPASRDNFAYFREDDQKEVPAKQQKQEKPQQRHEHIPISLGNFNRIHQHEQHDGDKEKPDQNTIIPSSNTTNNNNNDQNHQHHDEKQEQEQEHEEHEEILQDVDDHIIHLKEQLAHEITENGYEENTSDLFVDILLQLADRYELLILELTNNNNQQRNQEEEKEHHQKKETALLLAFYRVQRNEILSKLLSTREAVYGAEHKAAAQILIMIGEARRHDGLFSESVSTLERALSICEKEYGVEHEETANVLSHLGLTYHSQIVHDHSNTNENAEQLESLKYETLEKSIDIYEKCSEFEIADEMRAAWNILKD